MSQISLLPQTKKLKRSQSAINADDDEEDDETPLFSSSPSESESEDDRIGTSLYRSIGSGNVGRNLLLKMGWREGDGLGVGGFGRVEPVPISDKRGGDLTGIGKTSLDTRTIASSTANRRALESERQLNENEAEKQNRLILTEKKQAQKEDVNQALKTYRCELCQKQYDRPSTFEAHLNSYDHHHKKRFMEMKQTQKGKTEAIGLTEKKREREKKREEKEMAKMAEAAGIQLSVSSAGSNLNSSGPSTMLQAASTAISSAGASSGGWKKVATTKPSGAGFKSVNPPTTLLTSAGWKSASVSISSPSTLSSSSGWKTISKPSSVVNSFQSSGFNTLDTSRGAQKIPSPPSQVPPPLPPPLESEPPPLPH